MKSIFGRWLPAIDGPHVRRVAVVGAGLAVVGGIAAGPASRPAPPAPAVNDAAAAALRHAVSADPDAAGRGTGGGGPERPAGTDPGQQGEQHPADRAGSADPDRRADRSDRRPSREELVPHGTQGQQVSTPLSAEQAENARAIVRTAHRMGLPDRAAVIGVATSLQESKLRNLGHLGAINDHDSQGLFQQRPSSGWGTPEQITDPEYASRAFFEGLRRIDGWQDLPLTDAAQRVQVSAYPFAYAQWEQQAADIVRSIDRD